MSGFNIDKLSEQLFYINGYCVDAKRNTISFQGKEQSIEPKVMQCLLVLAAHNGHVVSQEMLFEQVWPNSVFSPGSIRRAIAILRKAFGTDSTTSFLQTIPKKGYELNANIVFASKSKFTQKTTLYVLCGVFVMAVFIAFLRYVEQEDKQTLITKVEPITATSALEFNAKLSPDDVHIAFLRTRADEDDTRNLWVKELATGNEKLIFSGDVTEFTWLLNGQGLAFTNKENNQLYLQQVNLVTSVITPVMTLSNYLQPSSSLQLGGNHQLYLLARSSANKTTEKQSETRLWQIDVQNKTVVEKRTFDATFHPYEISSNKQKNTLAIAGFNPQGKTQIKIFDLDNRQYLPANIKLDNNRYFLSWHPSGNKLLLSDGRHLSTVNFTGEWQPLNYESYDFVQHPQYNQNADAIYFSYGKLDIDIAQIDLDNSNKVIKLVDSNTVDRVPAISPNGQKLAFISQRKGYPQLYLLDLTTNQLQLVYENRQQSLGLSAPIWGGNNRLAFSNYDFPVLVTLQGN